MLWVFTTALGIEYKVRLCSLGVRRPPILDVQRLDTPLADRMLPNEHTNWLHGQSHSKMRKRRRKCSSCRTAQDLNVEIPDFFAQRVSVQPQQFGGLDLIASCGGKSSLNQR